MANEKVIIELALQDKTNSIEKSNNNAKALNKTLERTQQLATGTRSGAQAVKSTYSPAAGGEGTAYGQARGAMGATGAGGRDFANQAQGLGGLVRLYATYAANVFAVSAAFSALRESMNTDIMIRSMDKLGAVSGVALGGLAKQFASASDGAISLREAMEATTKATSAGMSSKQFMELGVVAKGASQALGVSMSDAVSRLTRGITKLEPELLDELGIFTKVGKATEDYARSVGKSVDSLTDFEKRQAFANAVLKEGRDKFGEIAGEANPYDKLLASLTNVAQQILSVVNSVIAPIAKILANNTELIGLAIGAAAIKITQQALPALSQWRKGLADSAQEAAKRAGEINTSFGEAFVQRAERRQRIPQLDAALDQAKQEFDLAKKQFVELDNVYKKPNATLKALQEDRLLTERELTTVKSDITKKTNLGTEAELKHALSLTEVQLKQQKIVDLTKERAKAYSLVEEEANKSSKVLSEEWQREQLVANARAKAARLGALAGVGSKVEEKGLVGGLGAFYTEVNASKDLGRFEKVKTKAIGTLAGIGTAAGILGKALSGAFVYLEVAIATFSLFNMFLSKNGEAVDTFKSSMDSLGESIKTAGMVSEKFGHTLSTESINAKANAFTNLSDGISQATKNLAVADALASGWDKFLDGFKTIIGTDLRSVFSKGFTEAITSAIALTPEGELRQTLEGKLKSAIKTEDLGLEGVANAVSKVPSKDLVQTARNITAILEESRKIIKNSQALTQDVKETGKAASDAFVTFTNSVFGSSQLDAFLLSTTKNIYSIKNAFKDSTAAAAEFKNIITGTTRLEFLPQEQAVQLQNLAETYTNMQYGLKAQINNLDKTRSRITEIAQELKNPAWFTTAAQVGALNREQASLKERLPKIQLDIRQAENALKDVAAQAGKVLGEAASKQVDLVFAQTKARLAQLDVSYKQQVMQGLPVVTEASIKESTKLAKDAIDIEFSLKQSNENLINSIDLLRVQMELTQAQEKVNYAKGEGRAVGGPELVKEAEANLTAIENKLKALKSGNIGEIQKYVKEEPAALKVIMNLQNSRIAREEKDRKKRLEDMKGELALAKFLADKEAESLQLDIDRNNEAQKLFELKTGISEADKTKFAADTAAENAKKQARLVQIKPELEAKQVGIRTKYGLSATVGKETQEQLAKQMGQSAVTTGVAGTLATQTADTKAQVAAYKEMAGIASRTYEVQTLAATDTLETQKQLIAGEKESLSLAAATGSKTQEQIATETKYLSIKEAELELNQKSLELEKTRTAELIAWTAKFVEFGLTPELERERDAILSKADAAKTAAERDYQSKLRSVSITEELTSKQTQYEDVFKNSFQRMGDAIVEFAKTGKFSFKDLANAMLEDILRIEARAQTSQIWAALRPGVAAGLSSLFGTSSAPEQLGGILEPKAKGAAYDYGVQAFAKGGLFTNSIVDSPTMFKFAKGTGLMGEAGPEAIMPLTRDGSGNLGVRAQGGGGNNVEVVVNNFGSEKATTKETTDSRGNRRIEVVIGDMVAQEVSRTGSATQNAMSSTYGTRPALARR